MNTTQLKISNTSKKIAVVLKIGGALSCIASVLSIIAIFILTFCGEDTKKSLASAFDVTTSNGTILSIASSSLITIFSLVFISAVIMTIIIHLVHSIFQEIGKSHTPFYEKNVFRIKIIAVMAVALSVIGSFLSALAGYYAIGKMSWRIDVGGIVIGIIIYCIALVFHYGCELQKQSDETL